MSDALILITFLIVLLVIVVHFKTLSSTQSELDSYVSYDCSKQDFWTQEKNALLSGVENGHGLERLSDNLCQYVQSVRAKLVNMKLYGQYLEQQVKADALKFLEWNKLSKKIGKNIPIDGSSRSGDTEIKMADFDW